MSDFHSLKLPEIIAGRLLKIVSDSRRRRLSFQVLPATVLLQVPQKCPEQSLLRLIAYAKKHLEQRQADPRDLERYANYRQARILPFKGVFYTVRESRQEEVQLINNTLYSPGMAKLKAWYLKEAQDNLQKRSVHFSAKMGLNLPQLEIKSYRSRWGACYSRTQRPYLIRYNWQLVQTPPEILDYVVVHELCHLLFFNHSPHFKRMLQGFCPEYNNTEQWLESHGAQLLFDNPFSSNLA